MRACGMGLERPNLTFANTSKSDHSPNSTNATGQRVAFAPSFQDTIFSVFKDSSLVCK